MALPKKFLLLLEGQTKEVRAAFLKIFARARARTTPALIATMIEVKDATAILSAMGLNRAAISELQLEIFEAYQLGGKNALETPIKRRRLANQAATIAFNGTHPRAEAYATALGSRLVTEIVDSQREAIQSVIEQALKDGVNPLTTARQLVGQVNPITGQRSGGLIGLTTQQTGYVASARRELQELNSNYFTRTRRDRRYDSAVRSAIRTGTPLDQSTVDKISGRYSDRLLAYRGETVARTESINALRAGRHEGYHQLVDSGDVRGDQIIRVWDATGDAKTREDHLAMDGQTVSGFDAAFSAPDGSMMMYPGDGSLGAPADQVINCRCFERIEIDYIGD